ncbi:hypothetical protein DENIS_3877 [Desulfonema ishimotonii]|uniref:DUF4279 domain-containing protein n=1 Tax=Desulfonema ishimotonii TaxID=45657 RepID=A0A401G130_9BACT|nr:DUF4279 domain-containing protein [Desulfonema ishimotonii]GBC62893.1 hypothetical protein DENIS_3877 [Desulfonema ishimotonii]
MENYRINLAGFGIDDEFLMHLNINDLEITKKGDIWNKHTGKKYEENIIRISGSTTYEKGFGIAVDSIIKRVESDTLLNNLFHRCEYVELQIWICQDDDHRVPSITLSPEQMEFLIKLKANVDIDVM